MLRTLSLLAGLILPTLLLFCLVSPRDTLRDLRFVFNPRIIRRGLRLRRPQLKLRRPQFSLGFLLACVTVAAFQQAICFAFGNQFWWTMFGLTNLSILVFFAAAYLTSCPVPRRIHPQQIPVSERPGQTAPPEIDLREG